MYTYVIQRSELRKYAFWDDGAQAFFWSTAPVSQHRVPSSDALTCVLSIWSVHEVRIWTPECLTQADS